jgi:hypothetical protein
LFITVISRSIEESKRFMRNIKLISMNRRLFCMNLEVHEVIQGAVYVHHVHHDPGHVTHVQGEAQVI